MDKVWVFNARSRTNVQKSNKVEHLTCYISMTPVNHKIKRKYFEKYSYMSEIEIWIVDSAPNLIVMAENIQFRDKLATSFINKWVLEALKMLSKVVQLLVISLSILSTNGSVSTHNPFYCYAEDPIRSQHGMFSTTGAYETIRGRDINPTVSSCTPSKFWLITRHGTRLPSLSDLTNIFEHNERLHADIIRNYMNPDERLYVHLILSWLETGDSIRISHWKMNNS